MNSTVFCTEVYDFNGKWSTGTTLFTKKVRFVNSTSLFEKYGPCATVKLREIYVVFVTCTNIYNHSQINVLYNAWLGNRSSDADCKRINNCLPTSTLGNIGTAYSVQRALCTRMFHDALRSVQEVRVQCKRLCVLIYNL